jgi:hypothetical protein
MSALAPVAVDEQSRPATTVKSILDALVCFEVPDEHCIRRAVGRRLDPETGTLYHLDGLGWPKPPPVPNADDIPAEVVAQEQFEDERLRVLGLYERLEPMSGECDTEAHLHFALDNWQKSSVGLKAWYSKFGVYRTFDGALEPEKQVEHLVAELQDIAETEERATEAAVDALMAEDEDVDGVFDDVEGDFAAHEEAEAAMQSELDTDAKAAAATEAEALRLAEEAGAAAGGKAKGKAKPKKSKGKAGGDEALPEGADLEAFIQSEEKARQEAIAATEVEIVAGEPGYTYVSCSDPSIALAHASLAPPLAPTIRLRGATPTRLLVDRLDRRARAVRVPHPLTRVLYPMVCVGTSRTVDL